MARVPMDPPRTMLVRIGEWYSRRKYGEVLDPLKAVGHHPRVLMGYGLLEGFVERWDRLDPALKHLALASASARIGCSWCMDFGYWASQELGLPAEKMRQVTRWRDTDIFAEVERLVLEYAEAMTDTPPTVTDELVSRLQDHLDEAQLVELTMMVAWRPGSSGAQHHSRCCEGGAFPACGVRLAPGHTHQASAAAHG